MASRTWKRSVALFFATLFLLVQVDGAYAVHECAVHTVLPPAVQGASNVEPSHHHDTAHGPAAHHGEAAQSGHHQHTGHHTAATAPALHGHHAPAHDHVPDSGCPQHGEDCPGSAHGERCHCVGACHVSAGPASTPSRAVEAEPFVAAGTPVPAPADVGITGPTGQPYFHPYALAPPALG